MADRIGIIIEQDRNGWARVVTDRKGACGGCQSNPSGCRGCLSSSKIESRVANPIGARAGDLVKISMRSTALFKGAAIIYLVPIAALMLGAFTGLWASESKGWPESMGTVLGGVGGVIVGFLLVTLLGRSRYAQQRLQPIISAVVERANGTTVPKHSECCS